MLLLFTFIYIIGTPVTQRLMSHVAGRATAMAMVLGVTLATINGKTLSLKVLISTIVGLIWWMTYHNIFNGSRMRALRSSFAPFTKWIKDGKKKTSSQIETMPRSCCRLLCTWHNLLLFLAFSLTSSFWWGGRPGPDGTRRLYQITHDYLKNEKNLTNLIWTWNIQDFGTLLYDADAYNPGDEVSCQPK